MGRVLPIALGLLLAALGALPGSAAGEDAGHAEPCEPIVLSLTIDWDTFPPKVDPTVWIRPECLSP